MTISAILLAGGESTRMGRPKALLPWGETTLIAYQVRELLAAGVGDLVIVLGHAAEEARPQVPPDPSTLQPFGYAQDKLRSGQAGSGRGARIVVNEAYREGRASSLRAGAAALPDGADPIVVLGIDQPRPREVLAALLSAHREGGAPITVPVAQGRRGHPPVLAGSLLPELRAASEEGQGLRGVIAAHEGEVREVGLSSPIVLLDINTPEEYQEALARFGTGDVSAG